MPSTFQMPNINALFQKVMIRIFEPLLDHAIIYIDDILLFSKDIETHKVLLNQFFDIASHYGLMDFIPNVARYTSPLSKLLRKNPPAWGPKQTRAIQQIKKIAQSPPALKIPGEGKCILQTDGSDFYWGAVLIEELGGKKYYCGHANGQFKEAERHYHTTFKEALAVKME
ncbi:hypothetical protein CR513_48326, partial [Mucuna pruriens]